MTVQARVTFRPDPRWRDKLEGSDVAAGVLEGVARTLIKPAVEAATPRGASGQAHRSIRVDRQGDQVRVDRDGDTVRILSTDPFWHLIEWGSVNNPAYAPLRRGARAAGLRLDLSQL